MAPTSKPKVVVIGAGAAGVFTAYLLQKHAPDQFDITILESNPEVGGHTRSRLESYQGEQVNIDCGAQFFSETSESDYCEMLTQEGFFAEPGLITQSDAGVTIWNATQEKLLFRVPSTLSEILAAAEADPVTWLNFTILTAAAVEHYAFGDWNETFGAWLEKIPFVFTSAEKEAFKANVARPLMYQFGLVNPPDLDALSAKFVIYYYVGSLPWHGGPGPFSLYNSTIGLDGILKKLLQKYGLGVKVGAPVTAITAQGAGYTVTTSDDSSYPADEVVFGTNPQWTSGLLPAGDARFDALRSLLAGMPYVTVPVHIQVTNPTYMPGDPSIWSVSNVLVVDEPSTNVPSNYMLSVWFGPLRAEKIGAEFFKSWGSPNLVPDGAPRIVEQIHHLMVGTPDFIARRQVLSAQYQGVNHLWFAGGYILDYDTQNSCLKSAANVVRRLIHSSTDYATLATDAALRVQAEDLPETQFKGRPELLDAIERRIQQVAPDHPALRAWQAQRTTR